MYLIVIKSLFIFFGLLLAALLVFREKIVSKIGDNLKISVFISLIAAIMLAYVIVAVLFLFAPIGFYAKLLMLFFAASPFIVGKFVTYEKVKTFTILQILLAIVSTVCVYFI